MTKTIEENMKTIGMAPLSHKSTSNFLVQSPPFQRFHLQPNKSTPCTQPGPVAPTFCTYSLYLHYSYYRTYTSTQSFKSEVNRTVTPNSILYTKFNGVPAPTRSSNKKVHYLLAVPTGSEHKCPASATLHGPGGVRHTK